LPDDKGCDTLSQTQIEADKKRTCCMRLTFFLALCGLLLSQCTGCHGLSEGASSGVEVIVEGKGEFPKAIQGRWQADQDGWQILFEEDGQIADVTVSLGRVRVVPGQRTTVPTQSGGEGVFAPGLWTVHYIPDTTELTVKITMDEVRVEMGDSTLEGKSTDIFAGKVDLAEGLWQAEWTTFTDYKAHTAEGLTVNLSTDPVYGESKLLTFQKVREQ
jgi:hypothetical protein